jgi:DNA-binding transcriptional regulator YdaS (Cro superfamily)
MNLTNYLQLAGINKTAFAKKVGMSGAMLYQVETGIRPIPPKYCPAIEKETAGQVTRQELRPDDWQLLWPELTKRRKKTANPIP